MVGIGERELRLDGRTSVEDESVITRNEGFVGEAEPVPEIEVEVVAFDGLGYGSEGGISAKTVGIGVKSSIETVVRANPLVRISRVQGAEGEGQSLTDDGCGDGRGVGKIVRKLANGAQEFARSLHRPKVFGGGNTMGTAALIGVGEQASTLRETFSRASVHLTENGLDYGGHTDGHAAGDNCGCGAIDKAPQIVAATMTYRDEILGSIRALAGDEIADEVAPGVLDRFAAAAKAANFSEGYTGKDTMDANLLDKGKTVKELKGSHREVAVVLNDVRGCTVDQGKFRDATGEEAQVFAVDVWRLVDIAKGMYPDDEARQKEALAAQLVYTLATASVLTDGSLPVFRISEKQNEA